MIQKLWIHNFKGKTTFFLPKAWLCTCELFVTVCFLVRPHESQLMAPLRVYKAEISLCKSLTLNPFYVAGLIRKNKIMATFALTLIGKRLEMHLFTEYIIGPGNMELWSSLFIIPMTNVIPIYQWRANPPGSCLSAIHYQLQQKIQPADRMNK